MAGDQAVAGHHNEIAQVSVSHPTQQVARVIAVTSGKGGVGKTNIATNLGIALAALRKKVCIFDADMGLANINILIGMEARYSLEDVLAGERKINDVLVDGPGNIKIVPASSGVEKIISLGASAKKNLLQAFEEIEKEFDYLLIDTSAGISPTVISFILSARDAIVVVSPEPTSLTDAYSLIKVLKGKGFSGEIFILVNMVLSYEDSVKIFNKFNATTRKFLNVEMKYLGYVMMDQSVIASVIQQKPVMLLKPNAVSSRCLTSIARKFESIFAAKGESCFSGYWKTAALEEGAAAKEGVLTPPEEVKKNFDAINIISITEMANAVSRMIEKGAASETEIMELMQSVQNSFMRKFNQLPYDLKAVIYSSLELAAFSEEKIKELHALLQSIYEKRYKKSLHDLQDIFLQLLGEPGISESRMKIFLQMLQNSYQRQFHASIFSVKEILGAELSEETFFEDGFADLIGAIKQIYHDRFGVPYQEPVVFPLAEVDNILLSVKKQDEKIDKMRREIEKASRKRELELERLNEIVRTFDSGNEG